MTEVIGGHNVVDPNLGTVSYTFDLNGNQVTRTDVSGTLAFEYRQIGE